MSDVDSAVFAERLLQIVDEGLRTSTYKLALILALIDGVAAGVGSDGTPPRALHTSDIARTMVAAYYRQVAPFVDESGVERQLRQITQKRATITAAVADFRAVAESRGARTLQSAQVVAPEEYAECLAAVELTVARYPLRLLQTVGRQDRPFIYEVDWGEHITPAWVRRGGGWVRFRPGAAAHLLRLAPLVRPLVQVHWTRMVADLNGVDQQGRLLERHLFGADRVTFPGAVRGGLADLQGSSCFYCGSRIRGAGEVDHFIPWSRWPNDALENLVLADACNASKSNYLAARPHVERWADRYVAQRGDLAGLAADTGWATAPDRTLGLVRSTYATLHEGTPLWSSRAAFSFEDPAAAVAALAGLG